jgi:4-hydroxybenzoate polyprenyltransferase
MNLSWRPLLVFRPLNLLILIASQVLVFAFLNPAPIIFELSDPQFKAFVALALSSCLIAAAGYLINDLFDRELDKKNKPHKTYISHWTSSQANTAYILLNIIALIIGFWIAWSMFQVFLATILILYLYSSKFQRWPLVGNLSIAFLAGLSLLIVKFIAFETPARLLLFYAGFAFLVSLIREISKDIQDMEGDRLHKHQTAPIVWGINATKYIILALSVLGMVSYFGVYHFWLNVHLAPSIISLARIYSLIFVGIPFIFLIVVVWRGKSKSDFALISSICKYLMYTGMLGMVFF